MTEYTVIDSDDKLFELLKYWRISNIKKIAVDFEGEFNLHCYGEHLCLIQIFDKLNFYIIDPFKISKQGLIVFFQDSSVEKIWFSASSDAALVWKLYGTKICKIRDLSLQAKILGFEGGLNKLCNQFLDNCISETGISKMHNQKTNWMKRPLTATQIEYALSDVKFLFELQDALDETAKKENKEKEIYSALKKEISIKESPVPGYEKLPGYKRKSKKEKIYLKHFFYAREKTAEFFNKPPFMILDKYQLLTLANKIPFNKPFLELEIKSKNTKIKALLIENLLSAQDSAQLETEGFNQPPR